MSEESARSLGTITMMALIGLLLLSAGAMLFTG
jgi:hypothetical protein